MSLTTITRGASSAYSCRTTKVSSPRADESRAEANQSIVETGSPGTYGRVPATSDPRPRRVLGRSPNGVPLSAEQWEKRKYEWLPSGKDTEYLLSIMDKPVFEPGKFANYIAPPRRGINQQPIDFEYVRTER